jgi:pilus assembly protein CpaE
MWRVVVQARSNPVGWNGTARALVISPDAAIRSELVALLARELPLAARMELEHYPGRSALEAAAGPGTRLCLLDVGSQPGVAAGILGAVSESGIPVVAVLPGSEPDLILQCLRQGASEFLIRPFNASQFQAVLAKVVQSQPQGASTGGRMLCMLPGKGASGTTTLACNLAWALKQRGGPKVLLADLDGLCGTVPFLLKLRSSYSFVDALNHAGRLDADLWKALVNRAHGIDVLLSPESPLDGLAPPGDPRPLLEYARQAYEIVIADCGAAFGESNVAIASAASDLLLVTTTELPAVHATQRSIAHLENTGIEPTRLRLIVNRHRAAVGLSLEEVAQALGVAVFHVLPASYEVIHKALLEGRPAPASSPYGAAVAALAGKLTGEEKKTAAAKPSRLAGLFARLRG